jgi:hypothetical protein
MKEFNSVILRIDGKDYCYNYTESFNINIFITSDQIWIDPGSVVWESNGGELDIAYEDLFTSGSQDIIINRGVTNVAELIAPDPDSEKYNPKL